MASANADERDIPPQNRACISHEQLRRLVDYVKTELIACLVGKEDGRTRKTAILHIYGRIYMWAQSMVKLDALQDCLALAGCLRAILELYIDMELMAANTDLLDVERYFSFQQVEKWKQARAIVGRRTEFNIGDCGERLSHR